MRNFILLFVAALFVGCASPGVQVTTDDEKSQAIKAAYDGYLVNDFTASNELYSEETAIYINSVETISNEENLAAFSSHHDFYSDISMSRTYIQTSAYRYSTRWEGHNVPCYVSQSEGCVVTDPLVWKGGSRIHCLC